VRTAVCSCAKCKPIERPTASPCSVRMSELRAGGFLRNGGGGTVRGKGHEKLALTSRCGARTTPVAAVISDAGRAGPSTPPGPDQNGKRGYPRPAGRGCGAIPAPVTPRAVSECRTTGALQRLVTLVPSRAPFDGASPSMTGSPSARPKASSQSWAREAGTGVAVQGGEHLVSRPGAGHAGCRPQFASLGSHPAPFAAGVPSREWS